MRVSSHNLSVRPSAPLVLSFVGSFVRFVSPDNNTAERFREIFGQRHELARLLLPPSLSLRSLNTTSVDDGDGVPACLSCLPFLHLNLPARIWVIVRRKTEREGLHSLTQFVVGRLGMRTQFAQKRSRAERRVLQTDCQQRRKGSVHDPTTII